MKRGEQKTAWSEEDEKMFMSLHNLIYVVQDCDCDSSRKKELSDFLDALKNRVCTNPQQEWSKDDESNWNNIWDVLDGRFELSDYGYKEAAKWFLENCPKPPNLKC